MTERKFNAMGDLALIVNFFQSLSSAVSLPAFSNKSGQSFIKSLHAIEEELNQLKAGLDLADFVVPIDNLLEPGVAVGALKALDDYVTEKAGIRLGFLYQDLIDDCVSKIHEQHERQEAKLKEDKAGYTVPSAPATSAALVQQRRQKEKPVLHTHPYTRSRPSDLHTPRRSLLTLTNLSKSSSPPSSSLKHCSPRLLHPVAQSPGTFLQQPWRT